MDVVRAIHDAPHKEQTLTADHRDSPRRHSRMNYSEYLQLPELLSCQRLRSDEHDELLFVIIHQTTELWMKLCIHELRAVVRHMHADDLPPAFKMLSRVGRIQSHLTEAWETLATMTPADYLKFRHTLGTASGLQSYQYRLIEFLLGAKDAAMLELQRGTPEYGELAAAFAAPSLYDETLQLLARRGFAIPATVLERDSAPAVVANPAVEAAWLTIYHYVRALLGSLRAGRKARRRRVPFSEVALRTPQNGRTRHRFPPRNRRHGRRRLPRDAPRAGSSGTLHAADGDVTARVAPIPARRAHACFAGICG